MFENSEIKYQPMFLQCLQIYFLHSKFLVTDLKYKCQKNISASCGFFGLLNAKHKFLIINKNFYKQLNTPPPPLPSLRPCRPYLSYVSLLSALDKTSYAKLISLN